MPQRLHNLMKGKDKHVTARVPQAKTIVDNNVLNRYLYTFVGGDHQVATIFCIIDERCVRFVCVYRRLEALLSVLYN